MNWLGAAAIIFALGLASGWWTSGVYHDALAARVAEQTRSRELEQQARDSENAAEMARLARMDRDRLRAALDDRLRIVPASSGRKPSSSGGAAAPACGLSVEDAGDLEGRLQTARAASLYLAAEANECARHLTVLQEYIRDRQNGLGRAAKE